jgi:outer membrane biosynthesis protein TonB
MTSRSIASRSSVVLVALIGLLLGARTAHAGKRLVVLEFEGPKGEKFRSDVEAAVKKGNTIVKLDDWMEKAEDLGATKNTARNVKKVAAKLKVDGVIVGDVEKRGPRYYLRLRLREGESGDYVAEVEVVVRQAKLGSDGGKVIKDELLPAIKELTTNRSGGDDDEAEPTTVKKKSGFGRKDRGDDDEEEEEEADDEEAEEEEEPAPKKKTKKQLAAEKKKAEAEKKRLAAEEKKRKAAEEKKRKAEAKKKKEREEAEAAEEEEEEAPSDDEEEERVASSDDEESSEDDEVAGELRGRSDDDDDGEPVARDQRYRPLEVGVGASATARRLAFTPAAGAPAVQGYRGDPVAGVMITADVFPLAFNAKNKSFTRNFGLTILFDRVVKIQSRLDYDDMDGNPQTATLGTTQQRYAAGLVYRHPIGDKMAVQGSVLYNRMKFVIDKEAAPAGVTVQIPNVDYTFIEPGAGLRYLIGPKMMAGADLSVGIVTNTGELQQAEQFGTASVLAIEFNGLFSYALTKSIDLRADLRVTTFGFSFEGTGAISNPNMDDTVEVPSGRDTYFGASGLAAYHF